MSLFVPQFYQFRERGSSPGAGFEAISQPTDFREGEQVFVGNGATVTITQVDWPIVFYCYEGQTDRIKHQNILAHTGQAKSIFFRQSGRDEVSTHLDNRR